MCHDIPWLYDPGDEPPVHRGAAIARSLGVPVDEPTDRLTSSDNLVQPMTFTDWEIDRFIRDNACAVHRSHLVKYPAANRLFWTANCPTCGPIMGHNWVRKSRLERIESDEHAARFELRDPTNSTTPLEDLYGG